jgi:hypothetical protein
MEIQILYWILNHFLYMGFQKDNCLPVFRSRH